MCLALKDLPLTSFHPHYLLHQALAMTGCIFGSLMIRVMPSKTAIVPVNQELMPQTTVELERCLRTVYVSNIDKGVDKATLRAFFEHLCGEWRSLSRGAGFRVQGWARRR